MTQTSEFVTPGHPDKVADFIVSYLLDRYIEKDQMSRVALECQIKDNHVTLGGEVTSAYRMGEDKLKRHVRDAICAIGYTPEYAKRWGAENCIDPDALDIVAHIGAQSPDIAQGVDADGWGDQGIFWGMATGTAETGFMPLDHTVAKRLGMCLYEAALKGDLPIGIDIKTQVTVKDGSVVKVVVAAPVRDSDYATLVKGVLEWLEKSGIRGAECVINGTGAYVRHASAGDCGTTGRKLAVDFYGGNCRIGGGSCWGKDPTKADVTLNVYARHLALQMLEKSGADTVYCAIDCCIGRREIGIVYLDGHLNEIAVSGDSRPAREVIAELGLRATVWAFKCRNGLFTVPDAERA
ncbi:MAG: methionine adenosyltransferase domain-containing protein [Kiritimatiellae bacterium]|nr:methionine adenosyltransferase domain-containing protein [Kiritimatiellia bacterium]